MLLINVVAGEPKHSPASGSGGIVFLTIPRKPCWFRVPPAAPDAPLNLDCGFGRRMREVKPPPSFWVKGEFLDELWPVHNPPNIRETNFQNRPFRLLLFCPHKINGAEPMRTYTTR